MEQHPVPQDITGFKFKLVGDMTLKQFGELAAGAILAYIFYASNWHPFLKWPFVILFGSLGIALAFLPIEERPLDLWIINFLKAIYRPTIFVWKKNSIAKNLDLSTANYTTKPTVQNIKSTFEPIEEVNLELSSWPYPQKEEIEKKPQMPSLSVDELASLREKKLSELEEAKKKLQEVTKQAKEETFQAQVSTNAITVDQLAKLREEKLTQQGEGEVQLNQLVSQNKNLISQIDDVKTKIGSVTGVDTTELKEKLDLLLAQKNDLSTKITTLSEQVASQKASSLNQNQYQQPRSTATSVPGVRVMDRTSQNRPTISLSNQPNVISGMVVTDKGGPIEGVIILIKDRAGNSIRALKTNTLGQFVVATPMENGTYYVEMEKPHYSFKVLEVTLTGQVLAPLEIPATFVQETTS